jgi:hypothetical protein
MNGRIHIVEVEGTEFEIVMKRFFHTPFFLVTVTFKGGTIS